MSLPCLLNFLLLLLYFSAVSLNFAILFCQRLGQLGDLILELFHFWRQFLLFLHIFAWFALLLRVQLITCLLQCLILLKEYLLILHNSLVIVEQLAVVIHQLLYLFGLVVHLSLHFLFFGLCVCQLALRYFYFFRFHLYFLSLHLNYFGFFLKFCILLCDVLEPLLDCFL